MYKSSKVALISSWTIKKFCMILGLVSSLLLKPERRLWIIKIWCLAYFQKRISWVSYDFSAWMDVANISFMMWLLACMDVVYGSFKMWLLACMDAVYVSFMMWLPACMDWGLCLMLWLHTRMDAVYVSFMMRLHACMHGCSLRLIYAATSCMHWYVFMALLHAFMDML